MDEMDAKTKADEELDKKLVQQMDLLGISTDGVFIVDRDKRIISFSEKAEQMIGYRFEEAAGKPCCDIIKTEFCEKGCLVEDTFSKGSSYTNIYAKAWKRDGSPIFINITVTPFKDINGEIIGAVVNFKDISEIKYLILELQKKNDQLNFEKNKYESIINSVSEGMFTIDKNWNITSMNKSAEKITGYSRDEAVGAHCGEIFKSSLCDIHCPMKETLYTSEPNFDIEMEITDKSGKKVPVIVNTSLLYDKDGKITGGVETFRDMSQFQWMKDELEGRYEFSTIVGKSKEIKEIYRKLEDVARTDSTVLIQGESGTGKELVARAIHFNSARKNRPFISLNCSALPETILQSELFGHVKGSFTGAIRDKAGSFELAHTGTLFLDEIGDISPSIQLMLLRFLQEREFQRVGGVKTIKVDIRVIAATNKDLYAEVENGNFREDLYYRLSVVPLELPPLRNRKEDIPLLVGHFLEKFDQKMGKRIKGLSKDAIDKLLAYSWPGNIRELENAIEYMFVHTKGIMINVDNLPKHIIINGGDDISIEAYSNEASSGKDAVGHFEKRVIEKCLRDVNWSRKLAAEKLGISPVTLWRKMKKYGIG